MICFVLHDPLTQEAGVKRFTGDGVGVGDVNGAVGGGAEEAAADVFAGVAGDAAQVGSAPGGCARGQGWRAPAKPRRRPGQQRPWRPTPALPW